MNRIKVMLSALAIFVISCGYPQPKQIKGSDEYQLTYCSDEKDCFKAAEKTCPNGYRVTKYGNIRPEKFVCKE